MVTRAVKYIIVFSFLLFALPAYSESEEYVILLHGLIRTSNSMNEIEQFLIENDYQVININYPSRKHEIQSLALIVRDEVVSKTSHAEKVHFITHSMGGIILRYIMKHAPIPNLGRVVMLSPPNHGSEVVDVFGENIFFEWIAGPAGKQLGTDDNLLNSGDEKIDFELGIITGDRSINLIGSMIIEGDDDGKVSVESARLKGMSDFLVVNASHTFIMRDEYVITQCVHFLKYGHFKRE